MTQGQRLMALVAVFVLQQAMLVQGVVQGERNLVGGTVVRLAIEGRDPVDPARGRYVTFRLREDRPPITSPRLCHAQAPVAVVFGVGDDDMATVTEVREDPPTSGLWMWATPERGPWAPPDDCEASLGLDRFYLSEDDASHADTLLWAANGADAGAFVEVRLLDGNAVITALVVDGERFGD